MGVEFPRLPFLLVGASVSGFPGGIFVFIRGLGGFSGDALLRDPRGPESIFVFPFFSSPFVPPCFVLPVPFPPLVSEKTYGTNDLARG